MLSYFVYLVWISLFGTMYEKMIQVTNSFASMNPIYKSALKVETLFLLFRILDYDWNDAWIASRDKWSHSFATLYSIYLETQKKNAHWSLIGDKAFDNIFWSTLVFFFYFVCDRDLFFCCFFCFYSFFCS